MKNSEEEKWSHRCMLGLPRTQLDSKFSGRLFHDYVLIFPSINCSFASNDNAKVKRAKIKSEVWSISHTLFFFFGCFILISYEKSSFVPSIYELATFQ